MKTPQVQYFQTFFEKKEAEKNSVGTKIKGYASTTTKDRYDDVVVPEAFKRSIKSHYRKNPIILFAHDSRRPIGKATDLRIDEKGLYIEADIVDVEIEPKIQAGILKTFSIGFIPKKVAFKDKDGAELNPQEDNIWAQGVTREILEVDLIEVSVVSAPANPDALFTLQKSVKDFFDKAKNNELTIDLYSITKDIMKTNNLLETKDEEIETPNPEPAEIPEDDQDGADEEIETPSDEIDAEEEGDEKSTEDTPESDEGEDDAGDTPPVEEEKTIDVEINGKNYKVDKGLINAKTVAILLEKNSNLQEQLDQKTLKTPLVFSEHSLKKASIDKKVDEDGEKKEDEKEHKGFKQALLQTVD